MVISLKKDKRDVSEMLNEIKDIGEQIEEPITQGNELIKTED